MHRLVPTVVAFLGVASINFLAVPSSHAVQCPPASAAGETIGHIGFGAVRVPLKEVDISRSGVLKPPPTSKAAGLSKDHVGITADHGTSVITWHVRYGRGCPGSLNSLLSAPIGTVIEVNKEGKPPRTYRVTERVTVPKGKYKVDWFRQHGPHRLALFSCADPVGGAFRKNVAIIAEELSGTKSNTESIDAPS